MNEAIYLPFLARENAKRPLKKVEMPAHLRTYIEQSEQMQRYKFLRNKERNEYYPVEVVDNNRAHTNRGCLMVGLLPLSVEDKKEVTGMFRIHDLPELWKLTDATESHDLTTLDKLSHPDLARKEEETEDAWGVIHFREKDSNLCKRYKTAKSILEAKSGIVDKARKYDKLALVAKIVDGTDGDNCFHYWASEFVKENGFEEWDGSPLEAFGHYQRRIALYRSNIDQLFYPGKVKRCAEFLFNNTIKFVEECWEGVDLTDAPDNLKRGLAA